MNVKWADKNATGLLKLVPWFEYRHARVFAGVANVLVSGCSSSPPFCMAMTAAAGGELC